MFNFFSKLEAPVKNEESGDGSLIVNKEYANKVENETGIDYTSLLDENKIEWSREEAEEAKNKFELVKEHLPEDFANKSYEERMEVVNSIAETLV